MLEGPAQGLFRPLAVGDVPPETVVNGFSRALGELGRHLDIPDFPLSRAMQGFEVIPAGAHDGRDVPADLSGGFGGLDIREPQPGELFPGIPQLPAGRIVELQGPRRVLVEDDDSVRRILEQELITGSCVSQLRLGLFPRLFFRFEIPGMPLGGEALSRRFCPGRDGGGGFFGGAALRLDDLTPALYNDGPRPRSRSGCRLSLIAFKAAVKALAEPVESLHTAAFPGKEKAGTIGCAARST